jgi:hypothetical protein
LLDRIAFGQQPDFTGDKPSTGEKRSNPRIGIDRNRCPYQDFRSRFDDHSRFDVDVEITDAGIAKQAIG